MGIVLAIFLLCIGGGYLARNVSQARSDAWSGPRTGGQRRRALARGGQRRTLRGDLRHMRQQATVTDWLEQRRHDRSMAAKKGTGAAAAAPPAPPKARPAGRAAGNSNGTARAGTATRPQVIRGFAQRTTARARKPRGGVPPGTTPAPSPPAGQPGSGRPAPPPAPPPPRRPAATPRTSPAPGRNGTMASGNGGVEQLVEGYSHIYASALAGNIHAKQAGIKASGEGSVRGAEMASMLSRTLSEPGHNYGPEVTEPIAKASQHLQAAAMAFAESDAALTSLLQMSVGELATSARQAPHHTELSQNGSK